MHCGYPLIYEGTGLSSIYYFFEGNGSTDTGVLSASVHQFITQGYGRGGGGRRLVPCTCIDPLYTFSVPNTPPSLRLPRPLPATATVSGEMSFRRTVVTWGRVETLLDAPPLARPTSSWASPTPSPPTGLPSGIRRGFPLLRPAWFCAFPA